MLSSCLKPFLRQYSHGTPIIAHPKRFGTVCVTASSLSLQPDLGIISPNFREFFCVRIVQSTLYYLSYPTSTKLTIGSLSSDTTNIRTPIELGWPTSEKTWEKLAQFSENLGAALHGTEIKQQSPMEQPQVIQNFKNIIKKVLVQNIYEILIF